MAEEKHHHYLFHHKKDEEDKPIESVYTETGFSSGGSGGYSEPTIKGYGATTISTESEVDYRMEEKHHKHLEHLGEMGAVAAGAYALDHSSFIHSMDNDESLACVVCEKRFVSKYALGGHMKQHPERPWRGLYPPPTGEMGAVAAGAYALDHSSFIHSMDNDESLVCVVCGNRFVSKYARGGHMKKHPERSRRGSRPSSGARGGRGKSSVSKKALGVHMNQHPKRPLRDVLYPPPIDKPAAVRNGNTTEIDLNKSPSLIDLNQPAPEE